MHEGRGSERGRYLAEEEPIIGQVESTMPRNQVIFFELGYRGIGYIENVPSREQLLLQRPCELYHSAGLNVVCRIASSMDNLQDRHDLGFFFWGSMNLNVVESRIRQPPHQDLTVRTSV